MSNSKPLFSLRLIDLLMMVDVIDKNNGYEHIDRISVAGRTVEFARNTETFVIGKRFELAPAQSVSGNHFLPFSMDSLKRWLEKANSMTKSRYGALNVTVDFYPVDTTGRNFKLATKDLDIEPLTHWHNIPRNPIMGLPDLFAQVSTKPVVSRGIPLRKIMNHVPYNPNISKDIDMNIYRFDGIDDWQGFSVSGLVGAYRTGSN